MTCEKQRLFMVSQKWYERRLICQVDQALDHLPALRTAIDGVAQGDQGVGVRRQNGFDDGRERVIAAVNVADGNRAA